MAEPHVISALKAKQDEIKKRISALKKEIKAQRTELEAVTKVMRMFEATPRTEGNRLFKRGTVSRLIFDALRANPEGLDAHQLADFIIKEEGFDSNDRDGRNHPPALHDGHVSVCGPRTGFAGSQRQGTSMAVSTLRLSITLLSLFSRVLMRRRPPKGTLAKKQNRAKSYARKKEPAGIRVCWVLL